MKKLLKATSAIVIELSLFAPLSTMAIDYTRKFAPTTTGSGTVNNEPGVDYYWAFHNPKFAQPDFNPNSTSNQFEYFTNTRQ